MLTMLIPAIWFKFYVVLKMIDSVYLYYSRFLSNQQYSLRHTGQSCDYMESCPYSVQNSSVYNLDRTSPQSIL